MNVNNQIASIEFGPWSAKDIRNYSHIKERAGIVRPDTYENGKITTGGIIDSRLGTSDFRHVCATCGILKDKSVVDCPGHFGHLELPVPVINGVFLDYIKSLLSVVCIRCSKLHLNDDREAVMTRLAPYAKPRARMAIIKDVASSVRFCNRDKKGCGAPVAKIQIVTKNTATIQFVATWNDKSGEEGTTEDVNGEAAQTTTTTGPKGVVKTVQELRLRRIYDILANISREDWELLGYDYEKIRPEDFMFKVFPISPVAIRPSSKFDMHSSIPSEDALTHKTADIIRAVNKYEKHKNRELSSENARHLVDDENLLQYEVMTFADNESSLLPKTEQKSGVPLKSVTARLKGKNGRFRNNLMGKRTNHCARSVITSDPSLSLDQLGVPIRIAMINTFPEVVTTQNIERLRKLVDNGRYVYPGANYAHTRDPITGGMKCKDLRYKDKYNIQVGDVIERHLQDGDPVLFNRQPSLHKMSIMCFRAKVIRQDGVNTFRINLIATSPFNADFDGDMSDCHQQAAAWAQPRVNSVTA